MNEYNAKEIFGNARALCPGLPEETYWLCDYISTLATPNRNDFHCLILSGVGSLSAGYCELPSGVPFPEKLFIHKDRALKKARYIQQLIDVATDKEFAADLRKSCGYEYAWPFTMKRVGKSPESNNALAAAANWWTGTIWLDRADYEKGEGKGSDGELEERTSINIRSNLSESDIWNFRYNLAQQISSKLYIMGSAVLLVERVKKKCNDSVFTHTRISDTLNEAFRVIGIDDQNYHCFLPNKILMYVTPDVVKVLVDDATEFTTVWQAN